jgi:hypothetical protein
MISATKIFVFVLDISFLLKSYNILAIQEPELGQGCSSLSFSPLLLLLAEGAVWLIENPFQCPCASGFGVALLLAKVNRVEIRYCIQELHLDINSMGHTYLF